MKNFQWAQILLFTQLHFACTAAETSDEAAATDGTAPTSSIGTLQIEAMNKVIGVTDPVVAFAATEASASAIAAQSFNQLNINTGLNFLASQGVSLGKSTTEINTAFNTANGSKAFCDTVNNGMKFFQEASAPDFNLCLLKSVKAGTTIKNSGFQVWDFKATMSGMSVTFRMKFSLETNADGSLKQFENFTCMGMGSSALSQSGYALQSIKNGKLNIHTRAASSMGVSPVKIRADVTGEINAAGRPVGLKVIDYAEASSSRSVHTKVKQSATNIQAIGYENSQGRLTQYLSFVELLDSNAATGQYYITKIAYGDGAALTKITEGGSTSSNTSSWDGDTLVLDSTEARRAKVLNRDSEFITAAGDVLDLTFSSAETYDCLGTADETFTADSSNTSSSACRAAFNIDQNGSSMCQSLSY